MSSFAQSVSEDNFTFGEGDVVLLLDRSASFISRGRVFMNAARSAYQFVSDADESNSSSSGSRELGLITRGSSEQPVAYITLGLDDAVKVYKALCPRCEHYVTVPGHPDRCSNDSTLRASVDTYRRLAWLGDSLHLMDVRVILLNMGVSSAELDTRLQGYTRASAQATYLKSLLETGAQVQRPPLGTSERQMSTAFEANYSGQFRTMYLRAVFARTPPRYDVLASGELESLVTSAPPAYAG